MRQLSIAKSVLVSTLLFVSMVGFAATHSPTFKEDTNFNWQASHLSTLAAANVFAIFWGGGSTTAPLKIGTNPPVDPWLNNKIATYEATGGTTPIASTARVQNFPNYIAQGSVSAFTTDVTKKMKAMKLDIDNHYEGNGDGNMGCAWDNSPGYNVPIAAASGSIGTVAAGDYNIIAGFYLWTDKTVPAHPVVRFYKGTVNVTHTNGLNYVVHVNYAETSATSGIASAPDLSLVEKYSFPAGAHVTFALGTARNYPLPPDPSHKPNPIPDLRPHINLNVDGLCYSAWYSGGSYTPQINNIATQAKEVTTATGHNLIAGSVMYTMRPSDSLDVVHDDVTNPYSITFALYNLMYEAQLMQHQYTVNSVDMVLLLNPDTTQIFQACMQYYCPIIWKPGITYDTTNTLIKIPTLQADTDAAIDRMQAKSYLTSEEAAAMKTDLESSGILTPPSASGRTVAGLPELVLVQNWIVKYLAENVPFGWGINIYDNQNPLLTPGGVAKPWETGGVTWLHKINHLNLTPQQLSDGINTEATKLANFLKDMNMVGNAGGDYKPDFIYIDKFERDAIPSHVANGFLFNGVDWDTYVNYVKDTDALISNLPFAIWQMPGAHLATTTQVAPAPYGQYDTILASSIADYVFGNQSLSGDFNNIAPTLGDHLDEGPIAANTEGLVGLDVPSTYYFAGATTNAKVYLTLAGGPPPPPAKSVSIPSSAVVETPNSDTSEIITWEVLDSATTPSLTNTLAYGPLGEVGDPIPVTCPAVSGGKTTCTYTIPDLVAGTKYTFDLNAVDAAITTPGTYSGSFTTSGGAASVSIAVTAHTTTSNSAHLGWTVTDTGGDTANLTNTLTFGLPGALNPETKTCTAASTTVENCTADVDSLAPDTTYNYKIDAQDTETSASDHVGPSAIKTQPAGTKAVSISSHSAMSTATAITVTWGLTDTGGDITNVDSSLVLNGVTKTCNAKASCSETIDGLTGDTKYTYTINASDTVTKAAAPEVQDAYSTHPAGKPLTPPSVSSITWVPKKGGWGELSFGNASGGDAPYHYSLEITPVLPYEQKQGSDQDYFITGMTKGEPYEVVVKVTDADARTVSSSPYTIKNTY